VQPSGAIIIFIGNGAVKTITVTSIPTYSVSVWQHIAVTYDGSVNASGVNMYINGVPVSVTINTNNLSGTISNTAPALIGARSDITQNFDGKMTEVRIWDVEQNAAFILDDYNGGVPKEAADKINAIGLPRFGQGALWSGVSGVWVFNDESNEFVESFQTNGMDKTTRTTDVPT
jgi:hypothetical protein